MATEVVWEATSGLEASVRWAAERARGEAEERAREAAVVAAVGDARMEARMEARAEAAEAAQEAAGRLLLAEALATGQAERATLTLLRTQT